MSGDFDLFPNCSVEWGSKMYRPENLVVCTPSTVTTSIVGWGACITKENSLAHCEVSIDPEEDAPTECIANTNEEEHKMSYINPTANPEINARNYLNERAYGAREMTANKLRQDFGLTDQDPPHTPAEFIERIKGDKFTVSPDKLTKRTYCLTDYIRWRDPSVKEDDAGFEIAEKAMEKAFTSAKDAIMVKTPAEGLAALEAFESQTFH